MTPPQYTLREQASSMPGHDIIVMGASAGGIESLRAVLQGFPADLPASVFIVLHQPADAGGRLAEVLTRAGPLPAAMPENGAVIAPGRIYVAPPDHHLLLDADRICVSRGPAHNRHRPAVDPLFWSASRAHGPRVIGVILSGTLDDGARGLTTIKRRGGVAVVEEPGSALFSGMPTSAIEAVSPEHVLRAGDMGPLLGCLARSRVTQPMPAPELRLDQDFELYMGAPSDIPKSRNASPFSCPECGGVLWEDTSDGVAEFQCRVGHSYTAEGLAVEQNGGLEDSLWAAIRSLEEHAQLRRRMMERFRTHRQAFAADRAEASAVQCERHAANLRRLVMRPPAETEDA